MTLSHSRMAPIGFFPDESQLSWLEGHNRHLSFLGGVPLSIRVEYVPRNIFRILLPDAVCGQ